MDPLYSQGLDYCSHTAYAAHKIIGKSLAGNDVASEIAAYARDFHLSFHRWYEALYRDKYHYLGDADLMWVAFQLDLSSYFFGPVRLIYDRTDEFSLLPYHGAIGACIARGMRFYNRRLAALAQKRWAAGIYGCHNLDRRLIVKQGFAPDKNVLRVLRQGLWAWCKLECQSLLLRPSRAIDSGSTSSIVPQNPALPVWQRGDGL
jgi:hypothetical protein